MMTKESEIIFYKAEDGNVKVEVLFHDETFWMTQKKMGELFGVQRPAITKHLKNIFERNELEEISVSSILEHTADDGKLYQTTFYNLDVMRKSMKYNETQTIFKEFIKISEGH